MSLSDTDVFAMDVAGLKHSWSRVKEQIETRQSKPTFSTEEPSEEEGSDGDVWVVYEE